MIWRIDPCDQLQPMFELTSKLLGFRKYTSDMTIPSMHALTPSGHTCICLLSLPLRTLRKFYTIDAAMVCHLYSYWQQSPREHMLLFHSWLVCSQLPQCSLPQVQCLTSAVLPHYFMWRQETCKGAFCLQRFPNVTCTFSIISKAPVTLQYSVKGLKRPDLCSMSFTILSSRIEFLLSHFTVAWSCILLSADSDRMLHIH